MSQRSCLQSAKLSRIRILPVSCRIRIEIIMLLLSLLIIMGMCTGPFRYPDWTPELDNIIENIYHDTESPQEGHAERMKVAWDRAFPMFGNVTANELMGRALHEIGKKRFRKSSNNDGIQQYFKWTPQLESDLLEIYNGSSPGKYGHSIRIHEEWSRRHNDLSNMEPHYLYNHAKFLINKIKSNVLKSPEKKARKPRESDSLEYFRWTPHFQTELLDIYRKTNPEERNHSSRIHKEWSRKYPQLSDMKPNRLRRQAMLLIERLESQNENKTPAWTKELKEELLSIKEREKKQSKVYDEWIRRHPEFRYLTNQGLQCQLNNILWERNEVHRFNSESGKVFRWTRQMNADLLYVHRSDTRKHEHMIRVIEIWKKMYPELYWMNSDHVRYHLQRLLSKKYQSTAEEQERAQLNYNKISLSGYDHQENRVCDTPRDRRKRPLEWTNQLNADLLYILHHHCNVKSGFWKKLYEAWGLMHPKLEWLSFQSFKNRASYLLDQKYLPSQEEYKQARINYDRTVGARISGHGGDQMLNSGGGNSSESFHLMDQHEMMQSHTPRHFEPQFDKFYSNWPHTSLRSGAHHFDDLVAEDYNMTQHGFRSGHSSPKQRHFDKSPLNPARVSKSLDLQQHEKMQQHLQIHSPSEFQPPSGNFYSNWPHTSLHDAAHHFDYLDARDYDMIKHGSQSGHSSPKQRYPDKFPTHTAGASTSTSSQQHESIQHLSDSNIHFSPNSEQVSDDFYLNWAHNFLLGSRNHSDDRYD